MVLGDRGDQVVQRRDSQVLVRGAHLVLQRDGGPLGSRGDVKERELTEIDRRQIAAGACLQEQRRTAGDQSARD